jgi:hypothetical protein
MARIEDGKGGYYEFDQNSQEHHYDKNNKDITNDESDKIAERNMGDPDTPAPQDEPA